MPAIVNVFFDPSQPDMFGLTKMGPLNLTERFRPAGETISTVTTARKKVVNEDMGRVYKAIIGSSGEAVCEDSGSCQRLHDHGLERKRADESAVSDARSSSAYLLATIHRAGAAYYDRVVIREWIADLDATALVLAIRQFEQRRTSVAIEFAGAGAEIHWAGANKIRSMARLSVSVAADGQWIVYSVRP